MNDKIRELAEQSGFFPVPDETEWDWEYRAENARYEKFAELIVNECCDVVINSDPSPKMILHEPYRTIMINIQEHFGVEV